ncbi:LexA family protein [Pseudomonas sp.]|uniref:LexA family protein n=1 Tax=Pseudomonas sp. TaxID=306 RepID=UPI003FD7D7D0
MKMHERIAKAVAASGKKKVQIAKDCGVSASAVTQWLSGESKSLKPESIYALAAATGFRAEWLAMGNGPEMDEQPKRAEREDSNIELALQPTRSFSYPEISWVQAGSATEAIELSNIAACPRHTSDVWAGENGFWLRVVGASMTSPAGGNSFPEGFLILIAPDTEPHHGQYVVARMIDTNEATFKQLVRDAGELYLKPLNPAFPMKAVDDAWEIVGTVVDGKMPKSVFF